MTKYEFSDRLRRALQGRLNSQAVESHIRYYEEYIDGEIRKGKTEEEVLNSLGDPRLIARTIIDSSHPDSASIYPGPDPNDDHSFGGQKQTRGDEAGNWRFFRIPSIGVIIVLILMILVIGTIAIRLAPLIILFAFIGWLIRRTGR